MCAVVKAERKRGRKYAKMRTNPRSRREAKRKKRNATAASPPVAHRDRGCRVTGGAPRPWLQVHRRRATRCGGEEKKKQRKKRDREEKRSLPWCCGQRRREPACGASTASVRGERAVAVSACTERAAARCSVRWRRRRQERGRNERGEGVKIAPRSPIY